MAATDTPMTPVKGQTALAWMIVLAIVAIGMLFLIIPMFSQDTARTSVDGDRATESKYIDNDR